MKNTATGVLAFLGGAVIGAGVALLFAPNKGVDTRRKIAEKLEELTPSELKALASKLSRKCECECETPAATEEA